MHLQTTASGGVYNIHRTKVASSVKFSVKKSINMLTSCGWFLTTAPSFESVFNTEYCEIFQSPYFEEHLQTAASENVFIKFIHKEI